MTTVIFKERTLFGMKYSVNCTEKSATCGHIKTVGVFHDAETLAVDHELMHITQAALV